MSVKKVTIEKKDLQTRTPKNEYLVRYRIISEDKNRTSHWSPIYTIKAPDKINVDSSITVTPKDILITWGTDNDVALYDIFINFKVSGTWTGYFYKGSSSTHSYSFLVPSKSTEIGYLATDIEISIQIAGIERTKNPLLTISTTEFAVQAGIDGGSA